MFSYEVWIELENGKTEILEVQALSLKDAHRKATSLLNSDKEFVRGVMLIVGELQP